MKLKKPAACAARSWGDYFSSILGSAKIKYGFCTCAIGALYTKPLRVQMGIKQGSSVAFFGAADIKQSPLTRED